MAIVRMSKIRLMGLENNRDDILNALQKTGSVQLIATEEINDTLEFSDASNKQLVTEKYERIKTAVELITSKLEENKAYKADSQATKDNFFVTYDEFMSAKDYEKELSPVLDGLYLDENRLADNRSERIRLNNLLTQLTAYLPVKDVFSDFRDTAYTKVFFGTIKHELVSELQKSIKDCLFTEFQVMAEGTADVILVVSLENEAEEVSAKLASMGFSKCPFEETVTAAEKNDYILAEISKLDDSDAETVKRICERSVYLKKLKTLADYYGFCLEKINDSERFRCTAKTFVLEGYLPKERESEVKETVEKVTDAVFIEFSEPEKSETPPTLVRNNPVVRQTEFITDLYSSPNYYETDPNKLVFFFFMLFMGVIMADVGYGFLMILFGGLLARRIKVDNGARRLWNIIMIGGVFTIMFGLLFNSFFGFAMPYEAILPSPVPEGDNTDGLMIILLGCLGLGVLQIATGYFCKAVNCFKNKDIAGGLFEGIVWVIFFIGFVFAAFNFLVEYLMPDAFRYMDENIKNFFYAMQTPGLIMVVGAVLVAAVTAGRSEKGFGKFSKGFGAIYGIINIMSDILSYARLFGLMLSGMIVATTFNDMGLGLMTGGIGYVFGPLVMVIGHVFNIAMGVLGAYIHDSRLQYIEFFSKFYTGEGEKFAPLGSNTEYVYITK